MTWSCTDNQAFRSDARKVLTRMVDIMKHPAITEHSWTQRDMDSITKALAVLARMDQPRNMVDRLLNDGAMATVENGLYWTVSMLGRNGFQDAKGVAWEEVDQEFAEATLAEHSRLTVHQRN